MAWAVTTGVTAGEVVRWEEEDIEAVATVTARAVTALAMVMPAESEASARDATEAMAEVTGSSESWRN